MTATVVPFFTLMVTGSETTVLPACAVAVGLPPKVRYLLVPGSTSRLAPVDWPMPARWIVY